MTTLAMYWAMDRALHRVVYWDLAKRRIEDRDVVDNGAVDLVGSWAVTRAMFLAENQETLHPALEFYLHGLR